MGREWKKCVTPRTCCFSLGFALMNSKNSFGKEVWEFPCSRVLALPSECKAFEIKELFPRQNIQTTFLRRTKNWVHLRRNHPVFGGRRRRGGKGKMLPPVKMLLIKLKLSQMVMVQANVTIWQDQSCKKYATLRNV